MIQWHPLFAQLLRPLLEPHYEVRTGVQVGDAPRVADIVLVQRASAGPPPFRGLWKDLTTWNVLEFKGPTVSPRRGDLERLVELGLGIHRRLSEEHAEQGLAAVRRNGVSFWYLANRLGKRFLRNALEELDVPDLESWSPGVWRCRVLGRLVFLVSGTEVAVEKDSLPVHVLGQESEQTELELARLVGAEPQLWPVYGPWVASFHPEALEELRKMAKTVSKKFWPRVEPLIELLGMEEFLRQVGHKSILEKLGPRIVEKLGPKKVVEQLTADELFDSLTPAQRRELKRRLQ